MRVSIVVPIYNIQDYLDECIQSILRQTYQNIEIILVDDGSTDGSGEICDRYAREDSRIVVIHKENGGLVSARKAGILKSKGDYIVSVDGDDWIDDDYVEKYVNAAKTYPDAVIKPNYCKNYENRRETEVKSSLKEELVVRSQFKERIIPYYLNKEHGILTDIPVELVCYFVKKEILLKCQMQVPNEITIGEDFICTFLILMNASSISILGAKGYHYRQRGSSIIHSYSKKNRIKLKLLYDEMKRKIMEADYDKNRLLQKLAYRIHFLIMLMTPTDDLIKERAYLFPYSEVKVHSKIIIYGAGQLGTQFINTLENVQNYNVIGWADKNWKAYAELGRNVIAPEKIVDYNYDYVVVVVYRSEVVEQIKNELLALGIHSEKIASINWKAFTEKNLPW